jgi:aminopeptidase
MNDTRIDKLARLLVDYSVKVRPGEKVLIQANNPENAFVCALVRAVYAAGGVPFVWLHDKSVERELLLGATEEQLRLRAEVDGRMMDAADCYIGFTAPRNLSALSDVPPEKSALMDKWYHGPVHLGTRLSTTRWVVLRYPTAALAQAAGMSEEAFEDFFFDVCTQDYAAMSRAMDPLVALLERSDRVRITAPPSPLSPLGTDLRFSIKGMPVVKCCGEKNIPDGEIYTAPVKDSVEGIISYNTKSERSGFVYEGISLTFREGRVVGATANDAERLNAVLDTDAGARYVGEFSFGVNPRILQPMQETLFDEKIAGSIHFTPGNAYDDCDNGNRSAVHWDLVLIQRPDFGGGTVYLDDVLVRKDGRFVLPELAALN